MVVLALVRSSSVVAPDGAQTGHSIDVDVVWTANDGTPVLLEIVVTPRGRGAKIVIVRKNRGLKSHREVEI